ncbi:hypothetical protein O6H91_20G015700 [Diphasiastrum complanatum]|uniref:Uncharacterized protein n=1 Tax=Diphasiastrum complanatum TaxID=34168 RepID=A0ACC2ANA8_DIPCM|nr:hypothetical protein O6H91_20G015700 [Diphasiastrum complanatum]
MGMDIDYLSRMEITDKKNRLKNSVYIHKKSKMQRGLPFRAEGSGLLKEHSTRSISQAVKTDRSFLRTSGRKASLVQSPLSRVKTEDLSCLNGKLSTARVLSPGDPISGPCFYMSAPAVALHECSTINMLHQASQRKISAGWKVVTRSFLEGKYIEFNFHEGRMVEIEAVDTKKNIYSFEITKICFQITEDHEAKDNVFLNAKDFVPIDDTVNAKGAPEDLKNRVPTALTSMLSSISPSELENSLCKPDVPIHLPTQSSDAAGVLIRKLECLKVVDASGAKDVVSPLRPSVQKQVQWCSDCSAVPSSSVCECSLTYEIDLKSSPYPGILKPSPHVFAEHVNNRVFESDIGRIEQLKRQWSALNDDPITTSNFSHPHESIHDPNQLPFEENSQHSTDKHGSSSAVKNAHRNVSLNTKKPNTPRRCSTRLSSLRVGKSQGIAKKSSIFEAKSCSSPAWSWRSPVKSTKDLVAQHSAFTTHGGKLSRMSSPCSSHASQSSKRTAFHNRELKSSSNSSIPHHISKSNSDTDFEPLSMKNVRCLPVPRITQGSGKLNLFSPRQHNSCSKLSLTACPEDPCTMVSGHVHCLVRDGVPSYTFLIKGSDEALVAKSWRLGSTKQDFMYAFYSWKQRGKGIGSWKNWKRKDKPASDFLGKMTATSKVIYETNQHPSATERKYINLEYVLFKESIHDQETDPFAPCSPRESASSWDSLSCQSPHLISTNCPPSPSIFHLLSPPPVVLGLPSPGFTSSFSSPAFSTVPQNLATLPATAQNFGELGRSPQSQCSPMRLADGGYINPFKTVYKNPLGKVENSLDSHLEHAGVVIKIPLETHKSTSLGDALTVGRNRGWGWNSVQKQTLLEAKSCLAKSNLLHHDAQQSRQSTSYRCEESMKANGKVTSNRTKDSRAALGKSKPRGKENKCEISTGKPVRNDAGMEQVNVTIILPAGDHGRPFYGQSGPQPLIERWQHGGRCDCGSWDLGCGLSILHTKLPDTMKLAECSQPGMRSLGKNETEDHLLTMFLQGSKEQQAVMSLKPLSDGLCSLTFQAPVSALQAFASAVAILYSMEPVTHQSKQETLTELSRPPRVPFKSLENCHGFT